MQLSPAQVRLRCSLARIPCVTSGEGMKSQRAPCKESANIRLKPYIRVDTANTVRAKWAHLGCVLKPDYRTLGSRIDGRGGWMELVAAPSRRKDRDAGNQRRRAYYSV
jgi:hypothetical protein